MHQLLPARCLFLAQVESPATVAASDQSGAVPADMETSATVRAGYGVAIGPGLHNCSVACQRDGTTVLPRAWDHLEVLSSMTVLVSGVNGDAPTLPVGGAFDDEGVRP